MRRITPRQIALVLSAFVLAVVLWTFTEISPLTPHRDSPVVINVSSGESLTSVASDLQRNGVISYSWLFDLDAAIQGRPYLHVGSYEFYKGEPFSRIRSVLNQSPNVVALNVLPGFTAHDIAVQLANDEGNSYAEEFLADTTNGTVRSPYLNGASLEGLLGVGRFIIAPGETPHALLEKMVNRFTSEATHSGLSPTTSRFGLNSYQLITAASIVEKEGYIHENMKKVARVILNRLRRGGPLQMDATILYYFQRDGGTVTHQMLETKTPYNSYLNTGLTPTPICSVSSYSLKSILNPAKGPWLYFEVVDKTGREAFSRTFAQQLANERLAASRGL